MAEAETEMELYYAGMVSELRAEIERLRSALEDIWEEPLDDCGRGDAKRIAYEALHPMR